MRWELDLAQFGFYFDFMVDRIGPGGFEIRLTTDSGKAFGLAWTEDTTMEWYAWDGHEKHILVDYSRFWLGSWYERGEIEISNDGDLDFGGGGGYTGSRFFFGENFTRIEVSCGEGFGLRLDNVALERSLLEGEVVSETVVDVLFVAP